MPNTIVMLHGAFAGSWCFESWRPWFQDRGWRTLALDLPHHGARNTEESSTALAAMGLQDYADDVAGQIATLPEKPILIGHSMGGLIAQILAARDLCRAAVLLTPAPTWGALPSSHREIGVALNLFNAGTFWSQVLEPVYEVAREDSLQQFSEAEARRIFERCGPESGRALFEMIFWMFDVRRASHVNAVNVECPLLVVGASEDLVISAATARKTAEKYQHVSTYLEFEGFGHMLLLEPGWEQIAQACLEWIGETENMPDRQTAAD